MSDRDVAAQLERSGGAGPLAQLLLLLLLVGAAALLVSLLPTPSLRLLFSNHLPIWVPASAIVFWRWSWAILHWVRAAIYRAWTYPRLRREARHAVAARGPVDTLSIVLATFKERPEITRAVVLSVLDELRRIDGLREPPTLIAVTGSDEDDEEIQRAYSEHADGGAPSAVLVLLRGANGKRDALAKGLEQILTRGVSADGAFVMMDGDTRLGPGALANALPLLRLSPPVYALTTNEHARVRAPAWFAEWIHLRHGQRHLHNCSMSLSGRLMCLTGRYSVFRADALDPGFIEIVRNDSVESWLWGRYRLLSGDDKSTWFYLLSQGRRLLYAPDCGVVTYEHAERRCLLRTYHNLRRWGGNMMRNNARAIGLGPSRVGAFCWWALIDQRMSVWTTLLGPVAALYMLHRERADLVAAYLLWVLCSRLVRAVPCWFHARRVSFFYAPVAVCADWSGALVKLWVSAYPTKQFWLNRGGRELDSTRGAARLRYRKLLAGSLLTAKLFVFVVAIGQLIGAHSLRFHALRLTEVATHEPLISAAAACLLIALSLALATQVSVDAAERA